jgi:phage baseplate assembly protein V
LQKYEQKKDYICHMLRYGTVCEIDTNKCLVRVKFDEDEEMVSDWLPVVVARSKRDKFFSVPDIDDQVACLMDEHAENGVVIGSIYSAADAVGSVKGEDITGVEFEDGTTVSYDRSSGTLTIDTKSKVIIKSPDNTIDGPLVVKGAISADGEVTAMAAGVGVKLSTHIHPTGVGPTGAPTPGT